MGKTVITYLIDGDPKGLNTHSSAIRNDAGTISTEQAKEKAYAEYDKFRLIQDKEFLSDFDKEIKKWKDKGLFDN